MLTTILSVIAKATHFRVRIKVTAASPGFLASLKLRKTQSRDTPVFKLVGWQVNATR